MQVTHSTPRRIVRNGQVYHEVEVTTVETIEIPVPDTSHLITEDETPVDNIFSEQQQRLLVDVLRSSADDWNPNKTPFLAMANVGIFASLRSPAIVPDVLLSMNVDLPRDEDERVDYATLRSYFSWEFGKLPDVVVEIVSNRKGKEMQKKRKEYEQMHIPYYIVYDPFAELSKEMNGQALHIYALRNGTYQKMDDFWLEGVGIGVRVWEGLYEGNRAEWLRWCDERGKVFPTGVERILEVTSRADEEKSRAEAEKQRADSLDTALSAERDRAERLAERLRALGISLDEV